MDLNDIVFHNDDEYFSWWKFSKITFYIENFRMAALVIEKQNKEQIVKCTKLNIAW